MSPLPVKMFTSVSGMTILSSENYMWVDTIYTGSNITRAVIVDKQGRIFTKDLSVIQVVIQSAVHSEQD